MIWLFVWPALALCASVPVLYAELRTWWRADRFPNNDWFDHGWSFIAAMVVGLSLVAMITAPLVAWADRVTCRNIADNYGLRYRWSVSAGCFLDVDGRWIPRDQVRTVRGVTP